MKRNPKRCLRAVWGRHPDDGRSGKKEIIYHLPTRSADAGILSHFFEGVCWPGDKTLVQELEARGFDITTLRFSIQLKEPTTPV